MFNRVHNPWLLWTLPLTSLAPSMICAMWIADLTRAVQGTKLRILVIATIGLAGFAVASSFFWPFYCQCWLWSIVVGSILLSFLRISVAVRVLLRRVDRPT
jgi:hypothetical protein